MATTKAKEKATSVTPEQKRQAAAASRAEKVQAGKDALEKAGMDPDTELDLDQRKRAAEAAEKKPGLSGKALQEYILNGKTLGQQEGDAKATRESRERKASSETRSRANVTRSKDPEATELAAAAKALAPEVKSAFLPKDARAFIDEVQGKRKAADLLSREVEGEDGKKETVSISQAALRKFAIDGEKDQAVRAHLTALGSGTRLWGRKLGLMILAKMAAEKKAK
jgi:hypothetical protein